MAGPVLGTGLRAQQQQQQRVRVCQAGWTHWLAAAARPIGPRMSELIHLLAAILRLRYRTFGCLGGINTAMPAAVV